MYFILNDLRKRLIIMYPSVSLCCNEIRNIEMVESIMDRGL